MAYIRIKNLKKDYHVTRTEKQEVLKGIDIEFQHGEFVALLGESGCGKTTFMNIMAGLDFDYTGSIVINKDFIRDFSERELDVYRKQKVGIIFQSFNLIKQMTAFENVMVPLNLSQLTAEDRKIRAEELLERVGLKDHMHKKPNQMSGGQKQRVAICRALANNPSIILADEPTGNLDSQSSDEIMQILKDIAVEGKLVICVTHSAKVAANCTRVLTMEDGLIKKDESQKNYKTKFSEQDKPTAVKDNIDKKEIWTFAQNNVKQNFKRSILVTTALAIGICSFVLMFFLSAGMKVYVENELTTGFNKLQINVYQNTAAADILSDTAAVQLSSKGNYEEYFNSLTGVDKVIKASAINGFGAYYHTDILSNRILSIATYYNGWTADSLIGNTKVGNWDNEENRMNIIISSSMMYGLASSGALDAWRTTDSNGEYFYEVIGATIMLNGKSELFKIVGVIDDSDSFATAYVSNWGMNILRDRTGSDTLNGADVNLAYVIATKVSYVDSIIDAITEADFYAYQQDSMASDILSYINLGSTILTVVSMVSLVVSAIMIIIVMYISVIERTKEIGILRALGTRRRDIKRIFMAEAGIIGIAAGVAGCLFAIIIGLLTNLGVGSTVVSISPWFILLGLGVSFLVSLLSSMGPSGRGANLDPIEALRANE